MAITKYKNERQKTAKTKAKNEKIKKYKKIAKTAAIGAAGGITAGFMSYRKGNSKSNKEGK